MTPYDSVSCRPISSAHAEVARGRPKRASSCSRTREISCRCRSERPVDRAHRRRVVRGHGDASASERQPGGTHDRHPRPAHGDPGAGTEEHAREDRLHGDGDLQQRLRHRERGGSRRQSEVVIVMVGTTPRETRDLRRPSHYRSFRPDESPPRPVRCRRTRGLRETLPLARCYDEPGGAGARPSPPRTRRPSSC